MSVKAAFEPDTYATADDPLRAFGITVLRKVETMSSVFASCGLYFE